MAALQVDDFGSKCKPNSLVKGRTSLAPVLGNDVLGTTENSSLDSWETRQRTWPSLVYFAVNHLTCDNESPALYQRIKFASYKKQ